MIATLVPTYAQEAAAGSTAGNISLSIALILGVALIIGCKLRNWSIAPIVLAAMFTVALSGSSAIRPTLDALNGAVASLINSVGSSGIV